MSADVCDVPPRQQGLGHWTLGVSRRSWGDLSGEAPAQSSRMERVLRSVKTEGTSRVAVERSDATVQPEVTSLMAVERCDATVKREGVSDATEKAEVTSLLAVERSDATVKREGAPFVAMEGNGSKSRVPFAASRLSSTSSANALHVSQTPVRNGTCAAQVPMPTPPPRTNNRTPLRRHLLSQDSSPGAWTPVSPIQGSAVCLNRHLGHGEIEVPMMALLSDRSDSGIDDTLDLSEVLAAQPLGMLPMT